MRKTEKGVTLIELMTVMVVLGVLAAIAVPSYRRYLLRAQRTDATTALLRLQTAEEKFLLQKGVYTTNLTELPTASTAGLGLATGTSERGFYQLKVEPSATGYTAIATPVSGAGQSDDTTCVEFSISETGVKKAKDSAGADSRAQCWR